MKQKRRDEEEGLRLPKKAEEGKNEKASFSKQMSTTLLANNYCNVVVFYICSHHVARILDHGNVWRESFCLGCEKGKKLSLFPHLLNFFN